MDWAYIHVLEQVPELHKQVLILNDVLYVKRWRRDILPRYIAWLVLPLLIFPFGALMFLHTLYRIVVC